MPELAEVEYFRSRWDPGIGRRITGVSVHPDARIFLKGAASLIRKQLPGRSLESTHAHGKNLLFRFSDGFWIGAHLGMTGRLFHLGPGDETSRGDASGRLHRPGSPDIDAPRHHHLVVHQHGGGRLVFSDPRLFGRITAHLGREAPDWWVALPPAILSDAFTRARLEEHLRRRPGSTIKAVLLDQGIFPGIGNWMADEVLWRMRLDPAMPTGRFGLPLIASLRREVRRLCRDAVRIIARDWGRPPDTWLFNHRWGRGGVCPRPECRTPLARSTIAGRTTCRCPSCQAARQPRNSPDPRRSRRS